eukprot:superscaffoldBa00005453_g20365
MQISSCASQLAPFNSHLTCLPRLLFSHAHYPVLCLPVHRSASLQAPDCLPTLHRHLKLHSCLLSHRFTRSLLLRSAQLAFSPPVLSCLSRPQPHLHSYR